MSLKKLAEDKAQTSVDIKKVTDYLINPVDIQIEAGFNARDMVNMTPRTRAHVDRLKESIRAGVVIPPLDVKDMGDGVVYVRDGHCRLTAMKELIGEGFEIPYAAVREFRGNDAEQLGHVLDTGDDKNKGLGLTRLEQGRQLAKLRRLGFSVKALAERFRVSEALISQNMTLADANTDVHALLDAESVPVKVALDAIRTYGEQAGAKLAELLAKSGKGKLTESAVSGRAVPKKAVARVRTSLFAAVTAIPREMRNALATGLVEDGEQVMVTAGVLKALLAAHAEFPGEEPTTDEPEGE